MRFTVEVGQDGLESVERNHIWRKQLLVHGQLEIRRRTRDRRKGDVAGERLAGIGQGVILIKLTQSIDCGSLHLEQIVAQSAARGHLNEQVVVNLVTRRAQGAHGGKNLRACLHGNAHVVAVRGLLRLQGRR